MFACLTDTVVAPADGLPAVRDTDAIDAFDATLAAGPGLNRVGLRAALYVLELAPLALGEGARMRRLAPARRIAVLTRLERNAAAAGLVDAMRAIAYLCYYGDAGAAARVGYDADAVVARGRALRIREARW
jgi:hypothetical protein